MLRLAATRLSHAPSQFHCPAGFCIDTGDTGLFGSDVSSDMMLSGRPGTGSWPDAARASLRCTLHACHAPWLPAASRGIESRTSSSSNVLRMYARMSYTGIASLSVRV